MIEGNYIKKILIIDSDIHVREALSFLLKNKLNHAQIIELDTVQEALSKTVNIDEFEYIITEFYTHKGNVISLLEYFEQKLSKPCIILYTTHLDEASHLQLRYSFLKIIDKFDYLSLKKELGIKSSSNDDSSSLIKDSSDLLSPSN